MPTSGVAPQRPASTVDKSGQRLVTEALTRIVDALGLTEETAGGDAALPLFAMNGPLEGNRIGEFRVFTRDDGTRCVYSRLSIEEFGMDSHQVYAFAPPTSPVPHLFLDTAISPNTGGTFHFGLDLVPRVDLGANLAYSQAVYLPLDECRAATVSQPGVLPVPSLGPLQWTLRSPWMIAAIVAPGDLAKLSDAITAYLDHWLGLVSTGLPEDVVASVSWQDLATRDRRNREAMFSPRTNPVWTLVGRLVGDTTSVRMQQMLIEGR